MCFGWRQCVPGASGLQSKERLQLAFLWKKKSVGGGVVRGGDATCGGLGPISHPPHSARPLLPEPSPLPVSCWTSPCGHRQAGNRFFFYLQPTTHLAVSLHRCPTLAPSLWHLKKVCRDCKHEHTISPFQCTLSFTSPVGFKLSGRCGGAHIPGYCRREYSWLWQKLYSCDILTVKFAG